MLRDRVPQRHQRGSDPVLRFYWREFLVVGVLGGFTTFSTFGLETYVLARTHASTLAIVNIGIQVVAGLAAVWLGHLVAVASGLSKA